MARMSNRVRRLVAERHGAKPDGRPHPAHCAYCGKPGHITWKPAGTHILRLEQRRSGPTPIYNRTFTILTHPLHMDHVIPLSKGGVDHPDNIVLACEHCNCSKCHRDLAQWQARSGR